MDKLLREDVIKLTDDENVNQLTLEGTHNICYHISYVPHFQYVSVIEILKLFNN
jgi:hypothetical protein